MAPLFYLIKRVDSSKWLQIYKKWVDCSCSVPEASPEPTDAAVPKPESEPTVPAVAVTPSEPAMPEPAPKDRDPIGSVCSSTALEDFLANDSDLKVSYRTILDPDVLPSS